MPSQAGKSQARFSQKYHPGKSTTASVGPTALIQYARNKRPCSINRLQHFVTASDSTWIQGPEITTGEANLEVTKTQRISVRPEPEAHGKSQGAGYSSEEGWQNLSQDDTDGHL